MIIFSWKIMERPRWEGRADVFAKSSIDERFRVVGHPRNRAEHARNVPFPWPFTRTRE